jgi:hypothetical protein
MFRSITALAALGLIAGTAFAQNDNTDGFYVGAGYGDYSVEISDVDDIVDVASDLDEDQSVSKYFAGWRFTKFIGIQADYYDLGGASGVLRGQTVSSDLDGYGVSVVGTLPIGFVELFARAGLLWYDLEVDRGVTTEIDASSEDAVYSAGVGFTVLERLNIQLEYEVIDINELDTSDAVWLNASWRF